MGTKEQDGQVVSEAQVWSISYTHRAMVDGDVLSYTARNVFVRVRQLAQGGKLPQEHENEEKEVPA